MMVGYKGHSGEKYGLKNNDLGMPSKKMAMEDLRSLGRQIMRRGPMAKSWGRETLIAGQRRSLNGSSV